MIRMQLLILVFLSCSTAINIPQRERVTVRSLQTRDLSENEKEIQLSAFGTNYHLLLKRSDIFAPDFAFVSVTYSPDGKTVLETKQMKNDPPVEIFSEVDGAASLSVTEGDQLQVEGILDDGVRIYPVDDDGTQTDHMVERQVFKRDLVQDYILIPETEDNEFTGEEESSRQKRQTVSAVTVEVLPVLDYPNSQQLGQNENKIKQYLGISWNNVNKRYSKAKDPTIKVIISGVVTFKRSADQTFINSNKYSEERVDQKVLDSFRNWKDSNKDSLPKHDTAMIHLSYDAGKYEDGKWNGGVAGLAYVGTTCDKNGYNVAFSEDKAPYYSGVEVLAHELAHSLNVPHDGDGSASNCPRNDGYLMGTNTKLQFSQCSLNIMRDFVRSNKGQCLKGSVTEKYPLVNEEPGLRTDPDLQCKAKFGNGFIARYLYDSDICEKLWCGTNGGSLKSVGTALEGTTCGYNQICIQGKCTTNPVPTALQQCKSYSSYYTATNENESNFCQVLKCRKNTGNFDSKGAPKQGTLCGNAGRCIDKVCVGEVPNTNVQCERLFGKATARDQPPTSDVCKTLWCKTSDNGVKAYGGAFESTKCGDNQFCKNEVCTKR